MNFRIHRQPEQEEGPKVTLLDLAAALVRAVAKWFPDSQANYISFASNQQQFPSSSRITSKPPNSTNSLAMEAPDTLCDLGQDGYEERLVLCSRWSNRSLRRISAVRNRSRSKADSKINAGTGAGRPSKPMATKLK